MPDQPTIQEVKKVLIVGAGPIGLAAACFLQRLGVDFDIIDSRSGPVDDSRALGVHARTLEFMTMFGLHKEFIRQGNITRYMTFHRFSKPLFRLDFDRIADLTDFPFMLILPQARTERILIKHLFDNGHAIGWETRFVSLTQDEIGVRCRLETGSGAVVQDYAYVIGADGANSQVRAQIGVAFEGETYDAKFLLTEAKIRDNQLPRNSSHVFMGHSTTVAVLPQPDDIYRIVGPDFQHAAGGTTMVAGEKLAFSEFQSFLKRENLLTQVTLEHASRLISYRIHKRVAARFQHQRVFLAGDAAHIHSPAGGQGMNTGIHDVMNLGWKIAAVLQSHAHPALLNSYHEERRHAVKAVVEGADQAMVRVVNRSFWWRHLLDTVAPIVTRWYQPKRLLATMAQLTWNYREQAVHMDGPLYQPGQRFPNRALSNGQRVHEILGQTPQPILLVSGADLQPATEVFRLVAHTKTQLTQRFSEQYQLTQALTNEQGNPFIGCVMIRPDGYVLAACPFQQAAVDTAWLSYSPPITA